MLGLPWSNWRIVTSRIEVEGTPRSTLYINPDIPSRLVDSSIDGSRFESTTREKRQLTRESRQFVSSAKSPFKSTYLHQNLLNRNGVSRLRIDSATHRSIASFSESSKLLIRFESLPKRVSLFRRHRRVDRSMRRRRKRPRHNAS